MSDYRYRVISSRVSGNGKRIYTIQDSVTGEVFERYAKFFNEKGDSAFINVSIKGKNSFSVLKTDKGTDKYYRYNKRFLKGNI